MEPRAEGQTHYVEHWVLYPNYQYPGPKFIGELRIVRSSTEKPYESAEAKYIRVTADEYDALPVAR